MNFLSIITEYDTIGDSLIVFEQTDEAGTYYWKIMFTPAFDSNLSRMIDAYNSDPSTKHTVTEEYIRYYLTEKMNLTIGNFEALDKDYKIGPGAKEPLEGYYAFINWLGSDAKLVFTQSPTYRFPNYTEDGKGYISEPGDVDSDTPVDLELLVQAFETGVVLDWDISNYEYIMCRYSDTFYSSGIPDDYVKYMVYEWEYEPNK